MALVSLLTVSISTSTIIVNHGDRTDIQKMLVSAASVIRKISDKTSPALYYTNTTLVVMFLLYGTGLFR